MTNRERFLYWLRGEDVDRVPVRYGGPRVSTFDAWMKQGLSEEQRANWAQFVDEDGSTGIGGVDTLLVPRFEKRIIEKHGNKMIWVDEQGATRLDHIDPATPGFITRSYLDFPVKTRDDFLEMKKRHNPRDPRRYLGHETSETSEDPKDWNVDPENTGVYLNRADICRESENPVGFTARGLFWTLRDWCGFEGLCTMFCDQPDLVHEMMDFWTDFLIQLYEPVLSLIKPDSCIVNEDMAYKHASMISGPMMKEFMVPHYKKLMKFFKGHGLEFMVMDSDGHNRQILEAFMPDAFDGIQPIEIAAMNDPAEYLAKYPTMVTWGGIDKRELRFDKARTRAEVKLRYQAARKYRRYIPTVDHGVPPDVPVRNFLYMVELLQGFARGEDLDTYEPPCDLERQLGPIEEMFDPLTAVPRPDEAYEEEDIS